MQPFNSDEVEAQYLQVAQDYERLAKAIADILATRLQEEHIKVGPITSRLKDFRSFVEKIVRKRYFAHPFDSIEDIAGVRVRCFFPSDTHEVKRVIESSLKVVSYEDKTAGYEENAFGYQSIHFVVRLPHSRLGKRLLRLADLKCEIQVRTLGQDAWGEVNHVLDYKSTASIPPQLRRRLHALSALFEVADREFEAIRAAHSALLVDTANVVQPSESINIATLSRLIAQRYPWFRVPEEDTDWVSLLANLCDELLRHQVEDATALQKILGDESSVDLQDEAARRASPVQDILDIGEGYSPEHFYDPVGRIRVALALAVPEYSRERPLLIE